MEDKELLNHENRGRSRGKQHKNISRKLITIGIIIIGVIIIGSVFYMVKAQKYKSRFFDNTTINGLDVSLKTSEQVKKLITDQIADYSIVIKSRDRSDQTIDGTSVGLEYIFDDTIDNIISSQNPYKWIFHTSKTDEIKVDTLLKLDQDSFSEAVDKLACFDESSSTNPEAAKISEYVSGHGYSIIPAVEGNMIADKEATIEIIKEAILTMNKELNIDSDGNLLYASLSTPEAETKLVDEIATMNLYTGSSITYENGKGTILNGDTISTWIKVNDDGEVTFSSDLIGEFVKQLATQYDTVYKAKSLKTSYGKTVKISGGAYGWKVNQNAEAEKIKAIITAGEKTSREPEYSRTAASHGDNDYGNTYVEINLTAQHLYYYKNGSLIIDSSFVSGNISKGNGTPAGVWPLTYKEQHATLKGEDYTTPVSYWMPFNNNIGMHDAVWRSSFGGEIYKTSGSHGCVNLPPATAKKIFENIETGCPVLCYELEGTGSSSTSVNNQTTTATTVAETTAATKTVETTASSEVTEAEESSSATVIPIKPSETTAESTETKSEIGPGM